MLGPQPKILKPLQFFSSGILVHDFCHALYARAREEAGSKCAGVGNYKLLSRKSLQLRKNFVLLPRIVKAMPWIVPWCNGSTRVFGSLSPRSNRSGTTSPSPPSPAFFCFFPNAGLFSYTYGNILGWFYKLPPSNVQNRVTIVLSSFGLFSAPFACSLSRIARYAPSFTNKRNEK